MAASASPDPRMGKFTWRPGELIETTAKDRRQLGRILLAVDLANDLLSDAQRQVDDARTALANAAAELRKLNGKR